MAGFEPGRFITDSGSISRKNNFLFYKPHGRNQYFTSCTVLLPHITVTKGSLRLFPPLANKYTGILGVLACLTFAPRTVAIHIVCGGAQGAHSASVQNCVR